MTSRSDRGTSAPGSTSDPIRAIPALDRMLADQVRQLVAGLPDALDSPPISERGLLHLQAGEPFRHLIAEAGGGLTGYLQLEDEDNQVGIELAAADGEVATALLDQAVRLAGDRRMLVWAHGARSVAHAAAKGAGFEAVRSLFQMRRPIDEPPIPDLAPPEGLVIRPFVVGQDEQAWLAVNARAFGWHPEQGSWTRDDLAARIGTSWFDPAGFLLAERDGHVLGFHWTKVHTADLGEVYLLGIDPDAQGLNLGQVLLAAGLRYLQGRGVNTVELYTEATNVRAVRLYGRFGFTEFSSDTQYSRG